MRINSILVWLVFCVFLSPGLATAQPSVQSSQASAAICARTYQSVPVTVTPSFPAAKYDNGSNLAQVQALSKSTKDKIPTNESVVLGLASYKPIMRFSIPMVHARMSDGTYCAKVQSLAVTVGYEDVVVHIAHEFPPGSCDYQAVLDHENKHIEVNRRVLNDYVPKLQTQLAAFLKLNGMFIVPNEAYADKLLGERLKQITDAVSKQMFEENARRQKLVDTPQEYAKNNTVCRGHIAQVVNQYRRGR